MDRVYTVSAGPLGSLVRLTEKVGALNRKAEKFGLPPLTLTQLPDSQRVSGGEYLVDVRLSGEAPVVGGWTVAARVEHLTDERNVVNVAPSAPAPDDKWFAAPPGCQHCRTARFRKETWVLVNADGMEFQVGSSCLADFCRTPDAADALAAYYSGLSALDGEFREFTTGRGEQYVEVAVALTATEEQVGATGWLSKRDAYASGDRSTAEHVLEAYRWSRMTLPAGGFPAEYVAAVLSIHAGHVSESARELVRWGRGELTAELDSGVAAGRPADAYLMNVATLLSQDHVPIHLLPYLVSAHRVKARWDALQLKKADDAAKNPPSEWVGEEGERIDVNLTLNRTAGPFPGQFGDSYGYFFTQTGTGNKFVWWTSGAGPGTEKGENADFRCTVKKHGEYMNVKQTEVSRLKKIDPDLQKAKKRNATKPPAAD